MNDIIMQLLLMCHRFTGNNIRAFSVYKNYTTIYTFSGEGSKVVSPTRWRHLNKFTKRLL